MNVLVLGVGSNVSQGIIKALREIEGMSIHVIGACISRTSVGLYLCDEALIMPTAANPEFVQWYINTCNNNEIDISFTGVEENIDVLVKNRLYIEKRCCASFVYPTREAWDIGFDKYQTCKWLEDNGIPYPNYALGSDDKGLSELIVNSGFPLIAKPRCGKSSVGIITAYSLLDLVGVVGRTDYIVQECVGSADDEYTVGCYFDKRGILASKIILHRYLKNGGTSMAEIVKHPGIDSLIDKVAGKLHVTGPLNIQIRTRQDGTPVCFEWNIRYSGATSIRNHFGFRDVEAAIREYVLSESVDDCFNYTDRGMAIRVEKDVFFDNFDFNSKYLQMKI